MTLRKLSDESMLKRAFGWCFERGRTFRSSGSVPQSIPCFEQAYSLASTNAELDYFAVDAAHMMGIQMPPDEGGLEWNEKSTCRDAEASSNTSTQTALARFIITSADTYHAKVNTAPALGWFEKYAALVQAAHAYQLMNVSQDGAQQKCGACSVK